MKRYYLFAWLKSLPLERSSSLCIWGARVITWLVFAMGFQHVLFSFFLFSEFQIIDLDNFIPIFLSIDYPFTGLISGMALVMLGLGLLRKKSIAWFLAILLFMLVIINSIIDQSNILQSVLGICLTFWLILSRPSFFVRSRLPDRKEILTFLFFALLFSGVFVFSFRLFPTLLAEQGKLFSTINTLLFEFTSSDNHSNSSFGLLDVFFLFSFFISVYILTMVLAPAKSDETDHSLSRNIASRIVEKYGRSSYAYLTLIGDKNYFFSQGGSLIAYKVQGRAAIILGDPIGPYHDLVPTIHEFQYFCAINDWIPAFCFTLPDYLDQYHNAGFRELCMGREGIVDLDEFDLSGSARSNYRKRYNRMINLGYRVEIFNPPISPDIINQLYEISNEWLGMTGRKEKRFFLGDFEPNYIKTALTAVVYTPQGKISAFVNLVPEYCRNEISIDLMRRREDAYSGTMDFLFVALFLWAKKQGYDSFNMGLCALSGVGEDPSDPLLERFLYLVYQYGSRLYDFKGLFDFKKKFYPVWVPQYLIYQKYHHLPHIWLAMARLNFGL